MPKSMLNGINLLTIFVCESNQPSSSFRILQSQVPAILFGVLRMSFGRHSVAFLIGKQYNWLKWRLRTKSALDCITHKISFRLVFEAFTRNFDLIAERKSVIFHLRELAKAWPGELLGNAKRTEWNNKMFDLQIMMTRTNGKQCGYGVPVTGVVITQGQPW